MSFLAGIKRLHVRLHRGGQLKSWSVQAGQSKYLLCKVWSKVVAMESQHHGKRVAPTTTGLTFSHVPCRAFIISRKGAVQFTTSAQTPEKYDLYIAGWDFYPTIGLTHRSFRCSSQCDIKIDPIYFFSTKVKSEVRHTRVHN